MKMFMRALFSNVAIIVLALTANTIVHAQNRITIEDRFAAVDGVRLHYLIAGKGDPVLLMQCL